MFKDFESIDSTFEELKELNLPKDKRIKLNVMKNEVKFEFLIYLRSTSKKVIVMGSGAFNREKMTPPIFNRFKWIDLFEESVILYNDPTLYIGEINIGWGYGNKKKHFIKEIGDILKRVYRINEIKRSRALYFGSSAGGFSSLMLASYTRGWVFVNNPQTDIEKYLPQFVRKLKVAVYETPYQNLDKKRSNVVEWFKINDFIPRIFYAQNLASKHDMENHYLPFIEQLRHLKSDSFNGKLTSYLYYDEEKGHNPMSQRETLGTIRNIFRLIK